MVRRLVMALGAALGLVAVPGGAAQPEAEGPVSVRLDTSVGAIVLELEAQRAPQTVANFLRYVDEGRFDGTDFYRALSFPHLPATGLIQGGVGTRAGRLLPPIQHEPTSLTGLSHVDGAVSMARAQPGSAQGDFFIILGGLTSLDAGPEDPGFAVFGRVAEGMDVVRAIHAAPIDPARGEGAMAGQMLAEPVVIHRAQRSPRSGPAE